MLMNKDDQDDILYLHTIVIDHLHGFHHHFKVTSRRCKDIQKKFNCKLRVGRYSLWNTFDKRTSLFRPKMTTIFYGFRKLQSEDFVRKDDERWKAFSKDDVDDNDDDDDDVNSTQLVEENCSGSWKDITF